jgi:hypothetical protein
MRTRAISLFVLYVVTMIFFVFPASVFAAAEKTCDCYCASKMGAVDQNAKVTSQKCESACKTKGTKVAAFVCSVNQHPSRNLNCFTKEQCTKHNGEFAKEQPEECLNGSHYCYPDASHAIKATLQVKIGGLSVVGDMGEYIEKVYVWLVGTATLIAIVWIMIGGFQWAFAAVSAEQINSAKKRMMNGVIGLVLLLSTYLILFTVNPQLLKMEVPRFPIIRTVSLTDIEDCKQLKDAGYELEYIGDNHTDFCGASAKVLKDPEGTELADDVVCNYTKCYGEGELCIPGESPRCMACEDLTANNGVLAPTSEICNQFNSIYLSIPKFHSVNEPGGEVWFTNRCFFSRDADVDGGLGGGVCARVNIDCEKIDYCSDYDNVVVYYENVTTELDEIDLGKNSGLPGTDNNGVAEAIYNNSGDLTLGSVCQGGSDLHDICGWLREDVVTQSCFLGGWAVLPTDTILQSLAPQTYNCLPPPDSLSDDYDYSGG